MWRNVEKFNPYSPNKTRKGMNAAKWVKCQQYSKTSFVKDDILYDSVCMKCPE